MKCNMYCIWERKWIDFRVIVWTDYIWNLEIETKLLDFVVLSIITEEFLTLFSQFWPYTESQTVHGGEKKIYP